MTRLLYAIFIFITLISCTQKDEAPNSQAKFTYSIEKWETLGSQTLVILDAGNPSALDQKLNLIVEVTNTRGEVFSKDTTITFTKSEQHKNFQLIVDTS